MARWALISGPRRSRKTAMAFEIIEELRGLDVDVGGYVQVSRSGDGRRLHELRRLSAEGMAPLAFEVDLREEEAHTSCSLVFNDESFARGLRWLEEDDQPVIFIGDVSKLELTSQGHHDAIVSALSRPDSTVVVLCVRADQLFYVIEKYGLEDDAIAAVELPVSESSREQTVTRTALDIANAVAAGAEG